jgi:hypothetical protein
MSRAVAIVFGNGSGNVAGDNSCAVVIADATKNTTAKSFDPPDSS